MSNQITKMIEAWVASIQAPDQSAFDAAHADLVRTIEAFARQEKLLVHEVIAVAEHLDREDATRLLAALRRFVEVAE